MGSVFADGIDNNIDVTIEITGVLIHGGLVYAAVFSNETDFKNEHPFSSFIMELLAGTLNYNLKLPEGE